MDPDAALLARDTILVTAAWTDDRQRRHFAKLHLAVLALGDPRRSEDERHEVVRDFKWRGEMLRRPCCVPWGLRPWSRLSDQELLSNKHQCLTGRAGSLMPMTVADCECAHARNKQYFGGSFEQACADYTNKETQSISRVCALRIQAQCRGNPPDADGRDGDGDEGNEDDNDDDNDNDDGEVNAFAFLETSTKALSPLEILRRLLRAERKALGENINPVSAEMHNLTRARASEMTDEEWDYIYSLADRSQVLARRNRLRARLQAAQDNDEHAAPLAQAEQPFVWEDQAMTDFDRFAACDAVGGRPVDLGNALQASVDTRPMSLEAFEAQLGGWGSRMSMAASFVKDASVVASAADTDPTVYFEGIECGAICKDDPHGSSIGCVLKIFEF